MAVLLEQVKQIEDNIQDARETLEKVKRWQNQLEAVNAKLEEVRQQPFAVQLSTMFEQAHVAGKAAEGALFRQTDTVRAAVPIGEVVVAFQDMANILRLPDTVMERLVSLREDQYESIDRALAVLRISTPAATSADSD